MRIDDPNLKLAICLPLSSYTVPTPFFLSFTTMIKPPQYDLILPQVPVGEHSESMAHIRNDLVHQAIDLECTHIAMFDTDQRYENETLVKLLSHDLPVVFAKVHRRYPPFDPILLREDVNDQGSYYDIPLIEWKTNKENGILQEVDSIGGGCSLIRTEVFLNLKYPWYRIVSSRRVGKRRIGEDMFLCTQRLKKKGYSIFVDLNIDIGHFTHMEADEYLYEMFIQYCVDRDKARRMEQAML